MYYVAVPKEDLKSIFDVATNSLDFGSGCLDTDEVNMLRRIAVLIGVHPKAGTPANVGHQYPHPFEHNGHHRFDGLEYCKWCMREKTHESHKEE